MSDHERIWLEPSPGADNPNYDRQWCQDNVWGDEATEYVRATEIETLRRENRVLHELRRDFLTLQRRIIGETGLSAIETIDRALKVFEAEALYEIFDEERALTMSDIHREQLGKETP